jgi:hypothetical protein
MPIELLSAISEVGGLSSREFIQRTIIGRRNQRHSVLGMRNPALRRLIDPEGLLIVAGEDRRRTVRKAQGDLA